MVTDIAAENWQFPLFPLAQVQIPALPFFGGPPPPGQPGPPRPPVGPGAPAQVGTSPYSAHAPAPVPVPVTAPAVFPTPTPAPTCVKRGLNAKPEISITFVKESAVLV